VQPTQNSSQPEDVAGAEKEFPEDQAMVVIIGAGIVGCSVAYHLAKLGWHDIVVLEKGPLFDTGGSTSASPGLVFQTNSSRLMTRFAQYSLNLFSELDVKGQPCFYAIGGIEVALTQQRWEDFKRKLGYAKAWGIGAQLITPEEAKNKIPLLDASKIHGAYYVPTDGVVSPVRTAEALAREAEKRGAKFYGYIHVTGIEVVGRHVKAVNTNRGRIRTDLVLVCTGIWGPSVGRMIGLDFPLVPMVHQYVRTGSLPELANDQQLEVVHPILRHQDKSMYFRQHGSSYGIGSYLHEPMPLDPYDRDLSSSRRFTLEHFENAAEAAVELLPALGNVDLAYKINGVFSFTPDGMPLLGESSEIRGLWIALAVWVAHSGGVGRAVAELMVDGQSSLDLRECDLNRFHQYALTPEFVRARATQQYREVYDIIHPLQQMRYPRNMRLSPFHRRFEELGAVFFENAGWERPQWFAGNERLLEGRKLPIRSGWEARYWSRVQGAEHLVTREQVALFDLTPFVKIEVTGSGALQFLQKLASNQIDQPLGKVVYTSMLEEKGGIMCDLTVTRLGPDRFLVLTGATSGMHDLAWIRRHAPGDGSVQVLDFTSSYCGIGLWGPRSRDLIEQVSEDDFSNQAFPYFSAHQVRIATVPALALRVSYVGELGWEIYAPAEQGLSLWDSLWEAGKKLGLIAAGGGAFDSLRLEKGYRLWGLDIHTEYNPLEAGLGFAVKLEKGDFIGREALIRLKDKGISRKLSCLTLDDPEKVVMGKEPIADGDRVLGYVTSANYGYNVNKGIAYGYLPLEYAKEGTRVQVYYFGNQYPATVTREPLVPKPSSM
jgi:dimethylglycine oxidase